MKPKNSKMLQHQAHFFNAFTFVFLGTGVTLHEPVKVGVSVYSMVIRLTTYDSSEINSAIVSAGEFVSAYSITSAIVTPLIRSTCCPIRPKNNINSMTEVR